MPYRQIKRGDTSSKLSWADVSSQTDEIVVSLTLGQCEALIALIDHQRWQTRWYDPENYVKDDVDAWIDDTIKRLMLMVDFSELIQLETEEDGTLRLVFDGSGSNEVDLKALLDDDYVNVEGDTMTGPLTIKTP